MNKKSGGAWRAAWWAVPVVVAAGCPLAWAADEAGDEEAAQAVAVDAGLGHQAEGAGPGTAPAVAPGRDPATFCFFAGRPADGAEYVEIRKYKKGKQSYGSVRDLLPAMAQYGQRLGGDAVIEYDGSQRFGFFPWRLVRPVARGTIIRWKTPGVDCVKAGGTTLATILAEDVSPQQMREGAARPQATASAVTAATP